MIIDLAPAAGLLTALVALFGATVAWRREGNQLRTLERIVDVLHKMDLKSSSRPALEAMQDDLVSQVFVRYVNGKMKWSGVLYLIAIALFISAATTIGVGIGSRTVWFGELDSSLAAVLIPSGAVLLVLGMVALLWATVRTRRTRSVPLDVRSLLAKAGYGAK